MEVNEIAEQLTPQQEFEKRLGDRIRKDIGELCPDDVLAGLVSRGIEQAFFEKRTVPSRSSYGYGSTQYETLDPWIVAMLRELLKEQMESAVKKWLQDNQETVREAIQSVVTKGAGVLMIEAFQAQMTWPMEQFRTAVANQLGIDPSDFQR